MQKTKRKQNRLTILFLLLFAAGLLIRRANQFPFEDPRCRIYGISQTILFAGLIGGWGITLRTRLLQKGIRRYLLRMCDLLILWVLLRGLKYYCFPPMTRASRYLWYSYYIPMLLYPSCSVGAALHIGKRDDWERPGSFWLLFLIPAGVLLLILTNDLHQLVFSFPDDGTVWSDRAYHYGMLYVLSFAWVLGCVLSTLIIMISRCRIPRKKNLVGWIPMLWPALGLCYNIAYVTGRADFFSDLTIATSFFAIVSFETAIRMGLIRSNSNYADIFNQSSIAAQILDDRGQRVLTSDNFVPYDDEVIQKVSAEGSLRRGSYRLLSRPISGGSVIWQEDLSEMLCLQEELESAAEYLEGRSMALHQSVATALERRRLEEQNRLYNEMQNQTADRLDQLTAGIRAFEGAEGEQEEALLLRIGIIFAYLKRRNNLIFLDEGGGLPASELQHCLMETARMLEAFHIECRVSVEAGDMMTFSQIVSFYDAVEEVIEETAEHGISYYITISENGSCPVLRIRIAGIREIPALDRRHFVIEQEEEEEILVLLAEEAEPEEGGFYDIQA